jgi:hypothetical protein
MGSTNHIDDKTIVLDTSHSAKYEGSTEPSTIRVPGGYRRWHAF